MTLMTMASAGATVKTAVPMATRRSLSVSMPISRARRQALIRKYSDCASTISTMIPASRNKTGWLTLNSTWIPPYVYISS